MRMVVMVAAIFISGLLALAGVSAFSESVQDVRSQVTGNCVVGNGYALTGLSDSNADPTVVLGDDVSADWTEGDLYISDRDILGSGDTIRGAGGSCDSRLMRSDEYAVVVYEGANGGGMSAAEFEDWGVNNGLIDLGGYGPALLGAMSVALNAGYDNNELNFAQVRFVPVPGTSGFLGSFISSGLDLVVPGMIFVLVIILLVGVYQFASKKSMR